MSSIHNLKQIVDILYEEHKQFESKNGLTEIPRLKHQIQQLESQIQLKDKELSDLYTKNAELENTIRRYEYDFELLTNLGAHPQPQQPQETPSPPPTPVPQSPLSQEDKKEEHKENVVIQEEPQGDAKKPKKDRREYMKAYHREYRRKRREQKAVEMTV
jgi:outer membrane biosynthesis protein TonB